MLHVKHVRYINREPSESSESEEDIPVYAPNERTQIVNALRPAKERFIRLCTTGRAESYDAFVNEELAELLPKEREILLSLLAEEFAEGANWVRNACIAYFSPAQQALIKERIDDRVHDDYVAYYCRGTEGLARVVAEKFFSKIAEASAHRSPSALRDLMAGWSGTWAKEKPFVLQSDCWEDWCWKEQQAKISMYWKNESERQASVGIFYRFMGLEVPIEMEHWHYLVSICPPVRR